MLNTYTINWTIATLNDNPSAERIAPTLYPVLNGVLQVLHRNMPSSPKIQNQGIRTSLPHRGHLMIRDEWLMIQKSLSQG